MHVPARTFPEREEQRAFLRSRRGTKATSTIIKEFYLRFPRARWSNWQLAVELEVDPRTVRKAVAKLPSFGFDLIEECEGSSVMAGDLPPRRYLRRLPSKEDPPGRPPHDPDLSATADPISGSADPVETSHGDLSPSPGNLKKRQIGEIPPDQRGSTRARPTRASARASRVNRPGSRERPQQRCPRPCSPARRAEPLAIEAGVWAALYARWGARVAARIRDELRLEKYHQHPAEALLVVRTLPHRTSHAPLRLFRGLFKKALGGAMLIDEAGERARTRACELAAQREDPYYEEPEAPRGRLPHAMQTAVWATRRKLRETPAESPLRAHYAAQLADFEQRLAQVPADQLGEPVKKVADWIPTPRDRGEPAWVMRVNGAVDPPIGGVVRLDRPPRHQAAEPDRPPPLTAEEVELLSRDQPLPRWSPEQRAQWETRRARVAPDDSTEDT